MGEWTGLLMQMRIQTQSQVRYIEMEYPKQSMQPGERRCSKRLSAVIRNGAAASETRGGGSDMRAHGVFSREAAGSALYLESSTLVSRELQQR